MSLKADKYCDLAVVNASTADAALQDVVKSANPLVPLPWMALRLSTSGCRWLIRHYTTYALKEIWAIC